MPPDAGPFNLDVTRLVLGSGGEATPKNVSPAFYEELGAEFNPFAGHVLIAQHDCDEPWPTWEMHPKGDEFVYLIEGDVDFVLMREAGEEILRVNEPGTYVVVPQGIWHTARPRKPTKLLFVTPGEGTLNAETPGSAAAP